ncbi:MarR family winged helix-turn-helix transcriptional regulator [Streptomyces malaysiensis]|uniref:MarR family winged helix-turn-helix transcriptional regulator n=1 Tax=Streptomyces malaysiensis subsp. samsunensis TaxID=459658 RepID=A0A9X2M6J2_STRMQ|nr:MarR family winged helix-turn-helix transcriptional regulator [Streptomyces samsunensis]MCQ8835690.1 MarR family winged helix-turn-helix transcriptional regulator [Streptomyces samsunensis]
MVDDREGLAELVPKLARLTAVFNSGRFYARAAELSHTTLERPSLTILGILEAAGEPRRIGEIAASMQVEDPHVTRHVQKLEKKQLVKRVVDPDDRRARLVAITPAGAAIATRYRGVVMAWLSDAIGSWEQHDRKEILRLVTRLVDDVLGHLAQLEDGPSPFDLPDIAGTPADSSR